MKILILSKDGDGLGIAQRMQQEGHSVFMYIERPECAQAGKGIIERVTSWRPHIADADLIICDMVGFGKFEKLFKQRRVPTFSCSAFMDQTELDREKGIELMRKVGIALPFTKTYDSPDDAKELLSIWEEPGYVIKAHDNASTASTLVVRHKEQFQWALTLYEGKITVQQIVEGVEVSTEGWFNGRSFITPFNHTFEEKRLFSNGGTNTGCMGNVVIRADQDKLVNETVMRLEPILRKINYRGPVDVNTIVNADGAFGLEFTSRLGYDAIEALTEGLKEPLTDLIFETALGMKKTMELGDDIMIAVRVSKSPWPHAEPDKDELGMPIVIGGQLKEALKHAFFTDAHKGGDQFLYSACDGVVVKVTAHGRTVDEARKRVYRSIDLIDFPDKQFRDDIGLRVTSDLKKLKDWGYV